MRREPIKRWMKSEGTRGWPAHHLDIHADGTVAVWTQDNPRDTSGASASYEEFLAGELGDLARSLVGKDAHDAALAFVREAVAAR